MYGSSLLVVVDRYTLVSEALAFNLFNFDVINFKVVTFSYASELFRGYFLQRLSIS
jgi:hypothetical protein